MMLLWTRTPICTSHMLTTTFENTFYFLIEARVMPTTSTILFELVLPGAIESIFDPQFSCHSSSTCLQLCLLTESTRQFKQRHTHN